MALFMVNPAVVQYQTGMMMVVLYEEIWRYVQTHVGIFNHLWVNMQSELPRSRLWNQTERVYFDNVMQTLRDADIM